MIVAFAIFGMCVPFIIFVVVISVSIENRSKKRQTNMKDMGECLININSILENEEASSKEAIYLIENELRELDRKISLNDKEE